MLFQFLLLYLSRGVLFSSGREGNICITLQGNRLLFLFASLDGVSALWFRGKLSFDVKQKMITEFNIKH